MSRDIETVGADKIRDIFEESFDEQVGSVHSLSDAEVTVSKEDGEMVIDVLLTGMAGSPSVEMFKKRKVKEANKIVLDVDGYEEVNFKLNPSKIVMINVNDFMLRYERV
jgi:hypothetical protein